MRILITGGAGYIGGVFTRAALAAGHEALVLDNLSTGHRDSVPAEAEFVEADIRETERLEAAVMAALVGMLGSSPTPLAPNGPSEVACSTMWETISGACAMRGAE